MSRRPAPRDRNTSPALGALVRDKTGLAWKATKALISSGKIFVDGEVCCDAGYRPGASQSIEIHHNAKTPKRDRFEVKIVFQDKHMVVIDKPSGVSSVPYTPDERGTAMDLLREAWRLRGEKATGPIHVVHRIDKDTSGLLMFARTKGAEIGLGRQLREHTLKRQYSCVTNGKMKAGRIESLFLRDRGDGLRGSNRHDNKGKRSVTHVTVERGLPSATLCTVKLETGRTHQIRIHLSESGHPIVGERVYSRDLELSGAPLIACPRLLLHAQTLGFVHPITGEFLHFRSEYPSCFLEALKDIETAKR